jgi:hypothetical protein
VDGPTPRNTEYGIPKPGSHAGCPADRSEMLVLFTKVLTWLAWLFEPTPTRLPAPGEPVLDTAGHLQQWTPLNTPLTSPHPRALNPLPEPSLG